MKFFRNPVNIYTLLWCLYYGQGMLYTEGGFLSRGILLVLLLWSFFCVVKVFFNTKNPYLKALNAIFVVFSVYGLIGLAASQDFRINPFDYIKDFYVSLLPIYAYYYYAQKGNMSASWFRMWAIVFLASAVLSYYKIQIGEIQEAADQGVYKDEVVNNAGYYLLSVIPAVYFFKKRPLIMYSLLLVLLTFIVLALKRGAMLIGAVCFLVIIIRSFARKKIKFGYLIMTVVVIIAIGVFIRYYLSTSELFQFRLEQTKAGDTSMRKEMYSSFLYYLTHEASLLSLLIGYGANGTFRLFGAAAHNDWYEIAINQGLLGLSFYVIYWSKYYSIIRKTRGFDLINTPLLLTFIIYFMSTLFSMSINAMLFYSTSVIGYCISEYDKIRKGANSDVLYDYQDI